MKFPLEGIPPQPEEEPTPSFSDYTRKIYKKFYEDHPNAIILGTEVEKDADGEYKLIINAIEPQGDG